MGVPQVAVEMMRLSALPADGHTFLVATMPQCGFRGYFPVRLYPFDDGIRVLSAAKLLEDILGLRGMTPILPRASASTVAASR